MFVKTTGHSARVKITLYGAVAVLAIGIFGITWLSWEPSYEMKHIIRPLADFQKNLAKPGHSDQTGPHQSISARSTRSPSGAIAALDAASIPDQSHGDASNADHHDPDQRNPETLEAQKSKNVKVFGKKTGGHSPKSKQSGAQNSRSLP